MVVEIENPSNRSMHYGDRILVTTTEVPDRLPQKVLYSPREAEQVHSRIMHDIYEGEKRAKPQRQVNFPAILKIILGTIGISALLFKGKSIFKYIKDVLTR